MKLKRLKQFLDRATEEDKDALEHLNF